MKLAVEDQVSSTAAHRVMRVKQVLSLALPLKGYNVWVWINANSVKFSCRNINGVFTQCKCKGKFRPRTDYENREGE
jgi:hypothetical protein